MKYLVKIIYIVFKSMKNELLSIKDKIGRNV